MVKNDVGLSDYIHGQKDLDKEVSYSEMGDIHDHHAYNTKSDNSKYSKKL